MSAVPPPAFDDAGKMLPVPAPLLGSLLAEIDDVAELKCTLRLAGLLARERGYVRRVAESRLLADAELLAALGSPEEIARGLALAEARGAVLAASGWLLLRTPRADREAERLGIAPHREAEPRDPRPNVAALYEENVGMLTPIIAEELEAAERDYPEDWIADAIRVAAVQNVRSWSYVSSILKRWGREGRDAERGKPGRHPEAVTAAELFGD